MAMLQRGWLLMLCDGAATTTSSEKCVSFPPKRAQVQIANLSKFSPIRNSNAKTSKLQAHTEPHHVFDGVVSKTKVRRQNTFSLFHTHHSKVSSTSHAKSFLVEGSNGIRRRALALLGFATGGTANHPSIKFPFFETLGYRTAHQ